MKQPPLTQLILLMFLILPMFWVSCSKPGSALTTPSPALPTPTELPAEQGACQEQGGRWEILGWGLSCNPPTSDVGQVCYDWNDCEGVCLGDIGGSEEITEPGLEGETGIQQSNLYERIAKLNSKGDKIAGSCSQWKYIFGCHLLVIDGKYEYMCVH